MLTAKTAMWSRRIARCGDAALSATLTTNTTSSSMRRSYTTNNDNSKVKHNNCNNYNFYNNKPSQQLVKHVEHLTQELSHAREIIRHLVPLVDQKVHEKKLKQLGQCLEGGGGLFIAENSQQLNAAIATPGARIVLREGNTYIISINEPITVRNTHISIIGNGATVVGCLAATEGATIDISNCFLFAPAETQMTWVPPSERPAPPNTVPERPADPKMTDKTTLHKNNALLCPILSATHNSTLHVRRCALINGRDGVYLGLNSKAYLTEVAIRNCFRGIYEGVGCSVSLQGCELSGNHYHGILLGPDADAHVSNIISGKQLGTELHDVAEPDEVCPPGFRVTTPITLKRCRADIVLDHDIIDDVYSRCYKNGKPVDLPPELSTAGLSDPTY